MYAIGVDSGAQQIIANLRRKPNVIPIVLSPLREKKEDIPLLLQEKIKSLEISFLG